MQDLISIARRQLDEYPDVAISIIDGTLAELDELVLATAARRIAVFTGRRSADLSGAWRTVLGALDSNAGGIRRFQAIPTEPDLATVGAMTDFLADCRPDAVLALGGGSVLDAAKAAMLAWQTGDELQNYFGMNRVAERHPGRVFQRIVALPTTAGTGSEATPYANIVNRELGVKQLISDPALLPEAAFLVPEFTLSMPRAVTLATGCDALAHLLEGWLNVGADAGPGAAANARAATGIALILQALPRVLADGGDRNARRAMLLAAALGGTVIRCKSTGLPHLASFSWFGRIEHGIAVARLLPAAWRYYLGAAAVAARTAEIGAVFGVTNGDAEAVIAAYEAFLNRCATPRLRDYPEITPELLARTARAAAGNRMKLELAPRPVASDESTAVLDAMLSAAFREEK